MYKYAHSPISDLISRSARSSTFATSPSMSWANDFFQRLLRDAVANDPSAVQDPVTVRFAFPARIGTLVTHMPGGGVQTANVVIPGCVVTLAVVQVTPLPPSGGPPVITNAPGMMDPANVAVAPAEGPYGAEGAYDASQLAQASEASAFDSMTPALNSASFDVSSGLDQTYGWPAAPRVSQCVACAAAGTPCWCGPIIDPELYPEGEPQSTFPPGDPELGMFSQDAEFAAGFYSRSDSSNL
ncbi:hypothetical protein K466DRAFT_665840 [Polyporus arcularius HHB13444]|uniref:Uncharacterized protein n=1 Tax=Polyporus arcularius HHB13444 TaxID=1314778 RepID=A0A5C3P582_9APHY|nr:hypothetical protein K466DRAFT_665840 [Polyporus arcularius HHB13444]